MTSTKKMIDPKSQDNNQNNKQEQKLASKKTPKANKSISTCGFLAWWEFKGAEATPDQIKSILSKHDTLKKIDVPSINKISALTQTIREFRYTKGIRARSEIATQDENTLIINLLKRVKVEKKKVEWHAFDTLIFDVGAESWLSKGESMTDEEQSAKDAFLANYERKSKYLDHNYIRPNIFQSMLYHCGAISLRNRGGIYFVPESQANNGIIADLSNFSDDMEGVEFLVCSMQSDKHTKKALGSQVKKSLETRLTDLAGTLDSWKAKTRNVRQDTITQVMEEFAEIRNLTEIYQESLSFKSEALLKELKEIEEIATDLILDQKTRGRGVSGAVVKRYGKMIEEHPLSEDGTVTIPFKYMEDRAWPDCSFLARFYKPHNKTSGYKALLNLGFLAEANEDQRVLTLTKI